MNYYDSGYFVSFKQSLQGLLDRVTAFLPNLLAAIIILIVGWLVGIFLSKFIVKVLDIIRVDEVADKLGLDKLSERTGKKLSIAKLGGWIVKWFFFLGSFIAAANVLNLNEVSQFLYEQVLPYGGHVIVAMAVLLLGILAANFFSDIVGSSVRASGFEKGHALASITKWAIMAFAVITALSELQIGQVFLQSLFQGVVAMLAIAGGLAFGLGGKDHAKKVLDSAEDTLSKE
jgi:hypothetical protein